MILKRATVLSLILAALSAGTASAVNPPRASITEDALAGGGGAASSARFSATSSLEGLAAITFSPDTSVSIQPAILNDPPVPRRDLVYFPSNAPTAIPISDLLANDLDLEADALSISLPGTNTVRGGSVIISGQSLIYTPPAQASGDADLFYYQITDGYGGVTLGTVVLAPEASAPRLTAVTRAQTGLNLAFRGLPNAVYRLQFRPDWSQGSVWRDYPDELQALTQRADTAGDYQFAAPLNLGEGYFRGVAVDSLTLLPGVIRNGNRLTMNFRGIPLATYKLQFRAAFDPAAPWQDYPNASQPITQQASREGEYTLVIPTLDRPAGFFRTVPRSE